jgi:hypothetical protein
MSRGRDRHAEEAPQCEELTEQLATARWEVVDA